MKGVILAAGQGTRMAELKLKHKSFAMINQQHVIDYSLNLLAGPGSRTAVSEIILVVGYHADDIIQYIGNERNGIPVKYVYQEERLGIAHAVKVAKAVINDDFVLCLADEILFNPRLEQMIQKFRLDKLTCLCGVIIDNQDFSMKPISYLVDGNKVIKVTEKPKYYDNAFRGVGECIFSRSCLDYLDDLLPNVLRGEYEMGDWIQMIVDAEKPVEVFDLADGYANINYARDIESAEDRMRI